MKIHGKILKHYLFCRAPVDKEGYLYKKGEVNTSYQKRWFTLRGNLLFYRDHPGERVVLGVIVLEGCVVQICESDEQFAFSLAFGNQGLRTYKLSAENQENQEAWVKAIHSAQHCFLSVLLQDLRQQYLEVAKTAGVEVVDCPLVAPQGMSHPPKSCSGSASVFYTQPGVKGPGQPSNRQPTEYLPPSTRAIGKRSPKVWPKWHAHVPHVEDMAPPPGAWSEPLEDFRQMHERFGKEVRRLMEEWKNRADAKMAVQDEDLIDLG